VFLSLTYKINSRLESQVFLQEIFHVCSTVHQSHSLTCKDMSPHGEVSPVSKHCAIKHVWGSDAKFRALLTLTLDGHTQPLYTQLFCYWGRSFKYHSNHRLGDGAVQDVAKNTEISEPCQYLNSRYPYHNQSLYCLSSCHSYILIT
jgi:hypothetical protein